MVTTAPEPGLTSALEAKITKAINAIAEKLGDKHTAVVPVVVVLSACQVTVIDGVAGKE